MNVQKTRTAELKRLDQLCDEFESLWKSGSEPSLADFVSQISEPMQSNAFRFFLQIEVERRRNDGQWPTADTYREQFPQFADEIHCVFQENVDTQICAETADTTGLPEKPPAIDLPNPFGDFELIEEIARGGMGAVFKARQISLDRIVALKVILAGNFATNEHVERFLVEARAAAKLRHPGIVAIYEVGQIGQQNYFSMEYVEGTTISDICRGRPLDCDRAAQYLKAAAEAVHHAHEQGVLHRDIKPANILVDHSDRVQITDFGLAKQVETKSDLTSTGQILGTPSYMSPEQASGTLSKVDHRSDIYSLGAVLYMMLSGRPVHTGESTIATIMKVIQEEPQPLGEVNLGVAPELARICTKCLAKNPEDRYTTAKELADDLEAFLAAEHAQTQPVVATRSTSAPPNYGTRLWGLGGLAALVLLAATVIVIKVGKKEVVIKTNGDARVEVEGKQVTVETNGKTVRIRSDDATKPPAVPKAAAGASPFDQLHRKGIDPYELGVAGRGLADAAPAELVAVLGDSRGAHWGEVTAVAFSPNGKTIASAGADKFIRIWDAKTLRQTAEWHGKAGRDGLYCLAISPDGKTLAYGGDSSTIQLWDISVSQPQQLVALKVKNSPIRSVAYSGDGRRLAATGGDGLLVWNCSERGVPAGASTVLDAGKGEITAVALNHDGSLLARGGRDKKVRIWKLGAKVDLWTTLDAHTDVVSAVAFSPDGQLLASVEKGNDGGRIWKLAGDQPKEIGTFKGDPSRQMYCVAFSPDSKYVAAAFGDYGQVKLWDIADLSNGVGIGRHVSHSVLFAHAFAVAFSPDGRSIVSGGTDNRVRLWDVAKREATTNSVLNGHGSPPDVIGYAEGGKQIVTKGWSGDLCVWSVEGASLQLSSQTRVMASSQPWNFRASLRADGKLLAVAANRFDKQTLELWDMDASQPAMRTEYELDERTTCIEFSPDGKTIAMTDEGGDVRLWDLSGGSTVIDRFERSFAATFSPDGRRLAVTGNPKEGEARVRIWDLTKSPPERVQRLDIRSHSVHVRYGLRFSPDGRRLMQSGRYVAITDVSGEVPVDVFHLSPSETSNSVVMSPDGTRFAVGGDHIKLRDAKTFEVIRQWALPGRAQPAFTPDGRHLISKNTNGTIYVLRLNNKTSRNPR